MEKSSDPTNALHLIHIKELFICKDEDNGYIETSECYSDSFMDVELHLKQEEDNKILFFKHKSDSGNDEYAPLSMISAYHLCREIMRVSIFPADRWCQYYNEKSFRVNLAIELSESEFFRLDKGHIEYGYSVFASDNNTEIATQFCSWVDAFLNIKKIEVGNFKAPEISISENGTVNIGHLSCIHYFVGEPLHLDQRFFAISSSDDIEQLEKNRQELKKDEQKQKEDSAKISSFFYVENFYIDKQYGRENGKSRWPGLFIDVVLFFKEEDDNKILLLKYDDGDKNDDSLYCPLTMISAYHLCKEIARVRLLNQENYKIKFEIEKVGNKEWYTDLTIGVLVSQQHIAIAEAFCSQADAFLKTQKKRINDYGAPKKIEFENGFEDLAGHDVIISFPGEPLDLRQFLFEKSYCSDISQLEDEQDLAEDKQKLGSERQGSVESKQVLEESKQRCKQYSFLRPLIICLSSVTLLSFTYLLISYLTQRYNSITW